jgi:hypothetical protein
MLDQTEQVRVVFSACRLRLRQPSGLTTGMDCQRQAKPAIGIGARSLFDKGVLQPHSLAKYAAAFFCDVSLFRALIGAPTATSCRSANCKSGSTATHPGPLNAYRNDPTQAHSNTRSSSVWVQNLNGLLEPMHLVLTRRPGESDQRPAYYNSFTPTPASVPTSLIAPAYIPPNADESIACSGLALTRSARN